MARRPIRGLLLAALCLGALVLPISGARPARAQGLAAGDQPAPDAGAEAGPPFGAVCGLVVIYPSCGAALQAICTAVSDGPACEQAAGLVCRNVPGGASGPRFASCLQDIKAACSSPLASGAGGSGAQIPPAGSELLGPGVASELLGPGVASGLLGPGVASRALGPGVGSDLLGPGVGGYASGGVDSAGRFIDTLNGRYGSDCADALVVSEAYTPTT